MRNAFRLSDYQRFTAQVAEFRLGSGFETSRSFCAAKGAATATVPATWSWLNADVSA